METSPGSAASRRLAFLIVLGLSAAAVLVVAYPLRQPLFLAVVSAAALSGWHARLARALGGRRGLAAALLIVGGVALVVVPLSLIATFAVSEAVEGVKYLRDSLAQGGVAKFLATLPGSMGQWVHKALMLLPTSLEELSVPAGSGSLAVSALGGALSLTSRLALAGGVWLIAMYVLLSDGTALVAFLGRLSPLSASVTETLLAEFRKASRAVLGSTIAVAAAQAAAATIGFLIGSVPHAIFFGLVTFFAAFIPGIGTALVALPLALVLWLEGHPFRALFIVAWTVLVVSMIDSLLKPLLMRGGMRLPGAAVFFALVGGILIFGPLGFIAGPLVVTFFVTMARLSSERPGGLSIEMPVLPKPTGDAGAAASPTSPAKPG